MNTKIDTNKVRSIAYPLLTLIFCLVAYVVYAVSMLQNDKNWVAIAALIYFFPLFIDLLESFENTVFYHKKFFFITIMCIVIGGLYFAGLVTYLTMAESLINETPRVIFKLLLASCPIVCIPIKAYPVCVILMQRYRRFFSK